MAPVGEPFSRPANVLTLSCKSAIGGLASSGAPLRRIQYCLCKRRDAVQIRHAAGGSAAGNRNGGLSASTPSWPALIRLCAECRLLTHPTISKNARRTGEL